LSELTHAQIFEVNHDENEGYLHTFNKVLKATGYGLLVRAVVQALLTLPARQ